LLRAIELLAQPLQPRLMADDLIVIDCLGVRQRQVGGLNTIVQLTQNLTFPNDVTAVDQQLCDHA
jgi:hypothetical protein